MYMGWRQETGTHTEILTSLSSQQHTCYTNSLAKFTFLMQVMGILFHGSFVLTLTTCNVHETCKAKVESTKQLKSTKSFLSCNPQDCDHIIWGIYSVQYPHICQHPKIQERRIHAVPCDSKVPTSPCYFILVENN